jgi:hypothetical protein
VKYVSQKVQIFWDGGSRGKRRRQPESWRAYLHVEMLEMPSAIDDKLFCQIVEVIFFLILSKLDGRQVGIANCLSC